jgi:prephenate dehydrogenase
MNFNPRTITICSVGLLGGSLGLAFKTSGFKGTIIGLSSQKNRETAASLGCIDEAFGYDALPEVIGRTDLLVLCSPINAIIDTIKKLGAVTLPGDLVITDVGSTKREIMDTAKRYLPAHVRFVGGHPMAGSEKSGAAHADPYLFQNAVYVLVPASGIPEEADRAVSVCLEQYLGCKSIFLDARTHDAIASTVSHVPHMLAVALMMFAEQAEKKTPGTIRLAAGGFRDMTRIASAPYAMWHDILSTNKDVIARGIDGYIAALEEIRRRLADDSLQAMFDEAAQARERIPARSKGFISDLSEITVVAKDQPGIIASMSAALAAEKININDIEVLKVREGEGGTIRLAFSSRENARKAVAVLTTAGFSARER